MAGWMIGVILSATGFDGMAAVQAATVAPAIRVAMATVLVIGAIITILLLLPYDLSVEKYDQIMREIEERKGEN